MRKRIAAAFLMGRVATLSIAPASAALTTKRRKDSPRLSDDVTNSRRCVSALLSPQAYLAIARRTIVKRSIARASKEVRGAGRRAIARIVRISTMSNSEVGSGSLFY